MKKKFSDQEIKSFIRKFEKEETFNGLTKEEQKKEHLKKISKVESW